MPPGGDPSCTAVPPPYPAAPPRHRSPPCRTTLPPRPLTDRNPARSAPMRRQPLSRSSSLASGMPYRRPYGGPGGVCGAAARDAQNRRSVAPWPLPGTVLAPLAQLGSLAHPHDPGSPHRTAQTGPQSRQERAPRPLWREIVRRGSEYERAQNRNWWARIGTRTVITRLHSALPTTARALGGSAGSRSQWVAGGGRGRRPGTGGSRRTRACDSASRAGHAASSASPRAGAERGRHASPRPLAPTRRRRPDATPPTVRCG